MVRIGRVVVSLLLSSILEEPGGPDGLLDLVRSVLLCHLTVDLHLLLHSHSDGHSSSGRCDGGPRCRRWTEHRSNPVLPSWGLGSRGDTRPLQGGHGPGLGLAKMVLVTSLFVYQSIVKRLKIFLLHVLPGLLAPHVCLLFDLLFSPFVMSVQSCCVGYAVVMSEYGSHSLGVGFAVRGLGSTGLVLAKMVSLTSPIKLSRSRFRPASSRPCCSSVYCSPLPGRPEWRSHFSTMLQESDPARTPSTSYSFHPTTPCPVFNEFLLRPRAVEEQSIRTNVSMSV